ncbi:hypothetical protein [Moraxella oblonga]|uniref:hypothetical protein n=1 Tax=Moraxella oblonga TaxID=200413 RepID=UPI0012EECC7E|nr:hypothetical protein [Moraxella oblonga]
MVSLWNSSLNIPLIVAVGVTCNAKIFTPVYGAHRNYHNWGASADGVLMGGDLKT